MLGQDPPAKGELIDDEDHRGLVGPAVTHGFC